MYSPYDVIGAMIHTEKGITLVERGCYQFWVAKKATKIDIKRAVENIYKVGVKAVNTVSVKGKLKRVRREEGRKTDWKKAYVTLKKGQTIELK